MTIRRRRRFYQTVQRQILVWAGAEPLQVSYDGENIWIPPRDEIARAEDPSTRYRYDSVKSTAGHYIPGTLEVQDRFVRTPEGGTEKVFDVALFCAYIERDRQDLITRGLEIVTDPGDCQAAMDECLPRYEESMDDRARAIIVAELERRKRLEEKGNPVLAGSSEHLVKWAFEHQQKRGAAALPAITTDDLRRAMLGQPPAESSQAEDGMAHDEIPESADIYEGGKPSVSTEQLAGGGRKAAASTAAPAPDPSAVNVVVMARTAKRLGINLVKKEMDGLLLEDRETIELVAEKIAVARAEAEQTEAASA